MIFNFYLTDHHKSLNYLSCDNSTHYQACNAKVSEAHCRVAQHQSEDDHDNLLDSAQFNAGRDTRWVILHTWTQL